ncbi:MAG TPA: hypothetical protein DCR97_10665 [Deltaproteobacteria bacterium]|nr:hypothetical protein [Deltaproteobacteria bacterium]
MMDIDYLQVIKWILIVLVAGFIGQFGRSLATYLIKRARGAKADDRPDVITEAEAPKGPKDAAPSTPLIPEGPRLPDKAEKKAFKALIKMKKKENK